MISQMDTHLARDQVQYRPQVVDVDSVLAYIRANPAAFRAQLRAISLGIDTRAIDWVAGYEWAQTVDRLLAWRRGGRELDRRVGSAHDLPRSPYYRGAI